MESNTKIATHYFDRAKERIGINRKRAERITDLAKKRGITYEQCNRAAERRYLQRRSKGHTMAIAYNSCCFIMDKKTSECVTIYKLPRWFGKRKTVERGIDDDWNALDA